MKKIILGIIVLILLSSFVLAMNLWIGYSSVSEIIVNQGEKITTIYSAKCGTRDIINYTLLIEAEGSGSSFLVGLPVTTTINNEISYTYYYSFDVPLNTPIGSYNFGICCTINSGGIGLAVCTKNYNLTVIENPNLCIPNWSCDEWSKCHKKMQTRTCIDLNNCGNEENKPSEIGSCWNNENIKPKPIHPKIK